MMVTPEERLQRILDMGSKLLAWLAENGITPQQVQENYTIQWTVTTPLLNIGEQTYQLSKEWKAKYPSVPWSQISGVRHRLVHNYEDTNWNIICIVLFEELEPFLDQLEAILNNK